MSLSEFGNLGTLKFGSNKICGINGPYKEMLMNISVNKMESGSVKSYEESNKELAILLLDGKIQISWHGNKNVIERHSVFDEEPWCLHVPHDTKVEIRAIEQSEIILQATENRDDFTAKLYSPEDCQSDVFGNGVWDGTARRIVRTVFDYNNAPYSNMVMGEVITFPGKWSSYPPHFHPQPEVYYYKFNKPQGFGLCLTGDDAHKITQNSYIAIHGGDVHPQTAAPGYAMYYCWMIRHLEGNPWKDRIDVDEHKWLWQKDVKIWPK